MFPDAGKVPPPKLNLFPEDGPVAVSHLHWTVGAMGLRLLGQPMSKFRMGVESALTPDVQVLATKPVESSRRTNTTRGVLLCNGNFSGVRVLSIAAIEPAIRVLSKFSCIKGN